MRLLQRILSNFKSITYKQFIAMWNRISHIEKKTSEKKFIFHNIKRHFEQPSTISQTQMGHGTSRASTTVQPIPRRHVDATRQCFDRGHIDQARKGLQPHRNGDGIFLVLPIGRGERGENQANDHLEWHQSHPPLMAHVSLAHPQTHLTPAHQRPRMIFSLVKNNI